jgi:hypothetical protein
MRGLGKDGYKDVDPNHQAEDAGQWQALVNTAGNEPTGSTEMRSFFTNLENISFTRRAPFHRNYHDHTQQHQIRRRPQRPNLCKG